MFRSLGPRGAQGANANFVTNSLAPLELLVAQAKQDGIPYRFHTRNDGTSWIVPCARMGGKRKPRRSSR